MLDSLRVVCYGVGIRSAVRTVSRSAATDYLVEFNSLPWESPMKGVRQKAVQHGSRRLRLVEYSDTLEPHWCEKGHVGLLLEGRLEITFDRGAVVFNPGDGIFISSGREHRHMARVLSGAAKVVFVEDIG